MGNEETKTELPNNSTFDILDYGYCKVWKRKQDGKQIMEEYPVYSQSDQRMKLFQSVCTLRKNHRLFVNVYHFHHQQTSITCSTSAKGSLFTERIQYRLSEFANIKYPQIVKIMRTCIEGYKELYEQFGLFVIRSTMIGISQAFEMKLWIHTDFSQPEPQNPNCKRVQEMFVSLINAVESTCQQLYYNCPKFSQFIVKTNYIYFSGDFYTLLQGLDDYVHQLGIRVPGDLGSMKFCFKKPQGWEMFKIKNNYPKLLGSQALISQGVYNVHYQSTQKNMLIQTHSHDRIELSSSKLSYSFPTNCTNLQTTNRMIHSNSKPHTHHQQTQSHKIIQSSSTNHNKPFLNQQTRQNQLSKTSYRFVKVKQKNTQNDQKFLSVNRFKTQLLQPKKPFQNIKFERSLNKNGGDLGLNFKKNFPKQTVPNLVTFQRINYK